AHATYSTMLLHHCHLFLAAAGRVAHLEWGFGFAAAPLFFSTEIPEEPIINRTSGNQPRRVCC
ncbi:MAG: hypothetical protein NTV22_00945, partial [bacterium]|nr:hypothetical protein [bacterium]